MLQNAISRQNRIATILRLNAHQKRQFLRCSRRLNRNV